MKQRILLIASLLLALGLLVGCGEESQGSQQSISVPSNIQRDVEEDMKAECTKYHQDKIYDFEILASGQGNITEKLQNEGMQEIWCVTAAAKCGNLPRTRNWIFTKASGRWNKTGGEYAPYSRSWKEHGCPFSMTHN